jgi:DNA polymerase-1
MATLAKKLGQPGICIYIGSSDKDILQLVDGNLKVYRPYGKDESVFGVDEVKQRYGVTPDKIADFLALKGDSTDNIPGVPGIGKKSAAKLVSRYGKLEDIFSNTEKIEPIRIREKIIQNEKIARENKELTKLNRDIDIDVDLDDLKVDLEKEKDLIPIFKELEFYKLVEKIRSS